MKKLFIASLAIALIVAMISAAYASGYNSPLWSTQGSSPQVNGKLMPHGGFADTTNRCKDCHAVHLATGSYKILRSGSTSGETACNFCHGAGGFIGTRNGVILNTSGHSPGAVISYPLSAPDDVSPGFSVPGPPGLTWGCTSCHSVHNNSTVQAISERALTTANNTNVLLKRRPDSTGPGIPAGVTVTLSVWCKECHGANYGTYGQSKEVAGIGTVYGHDAGNTQGIERTTSYSGGLTYAYQRVGIGSSDINTNRSPRCNQCHAAGAAQRTDVGNNGWVSGQSGQVAMIGSGAAGYEGYFPHSGYSTSYSLLKNSSNLSVANNVRLDDVCNDCHYTPSLP